MAAEEIAVGAIAPAKALTPVVDVDELIPRK
jgi:hypothetical protein